LARRAVRLPRSREPLWQGGVVSSSPAPADQPSVDRHSTVDGVAHERHVVCVEARTIVTRGRRSGNDRGDSDGQRERGDDESSVQLSGHDPPLWSRKCHATEARPTAMGAVGGNPLTLLQLALQREMTGQFHSRAHAELGIDTGKVAFDGPVAHEELRRDCLVRQSGRDKLGDACLRHS